MQMYLVGTYLPGYFSYCSWCRVGRWHWPEETGIVHNRYKFISTSTQPTAEVCIRFYPSSLHVRRWNVLPFKVIVICHRRAYKRHRGPWSGHSVCFSAKERALVRCADAVSFKRTPGQWQRRAIYSCTMDGLRSRALASVS